MAKSATLLNTTSHQIKNVDRMLPSQPLMACDFAGDSSDYYRSLEAVLFSVLPAKSLEDKWDITLKPGVSYATFGSEIGTLHFYQLLVRLGNIKTVLELGTYIGVSALFFAEAVGKAGRVTSVEFGQEFHDIAKENITRNGYGDTVELIRGCAVEKLKQDEAAGKQYDLILIDAAKERYHEMLDPALSCLHKGGLLLVDDVFFHGDTLNEQPKSDKGQGVRKLIDKVAALPPSYSKVILPLGNGLMLIYK